MGYKLWACNVVPDICGNHTSSQGSEIRWPLCRKSDFQGKVLVFWTSLLAIPSATTATSCWTTLQRLLFQSQVDRLQMQGPSYTCTAPGSAHDLNILERTSGLGLRVYHVVWRHGLWEFMILVWTHVGLCFQRSFGAVTGNRVESNRLFCKGCS
jgi:hypothetical protein